MKRFFFATLFAAVIALSFVVPVHAADPTVVVNAQRDRVVINRIVLTGTGETTLIAAGGADVFRDLTLLVVSNDSGTEVQVDIRDATAGTIRFSIDLLANGGSMVIPIIVPIPQAVANNNWTAQLSGAVTSVYITAVTIDN